VSAIPTFILILSGAATGLIGAMLGLGGGVFLVPLLALAIGPPRWPSAPFPEACWAPGSASAWKHAR
jgi:uncharacterized membrane protein YfcA